ncbi:hypothetical protein P692DRAFT_201730262 [Suillus brevipes Sb2]|nr:hypothetical protein P692DRAFT_201730262 [Suillus brevipes Sb2]
MCYSEDGQTFLDLFDANEFAEYRNKNLFYPFASKEEWEIADFLLRSPLSMAAIDMFLKLPLIQKLYLSFSNARELRSRAEMLPSGPSWKCQIIPSTHPTKHPIRLFWRDPIECLESLFSNPLFHDKLDFVPRRVYSTAAHLVRVYSEWMTGDAAWEMQTRFPRGATVLGTVLSSDKTNITTMTGARLAHPLLLGLANIRMHTRTKLSSKAFLLMALLPIPKYLYPNQRMRGVLEDRLVHECLSIILKPLMKAAEVGIMMSDPVGNIRHCFTPLAAYILASITVDPTDLEAYFDACTESRLNGVCAPFWMNWPLADPSIFLMSEALHHWHKEFFDHDCQWCLVAVGASELDFRFSILQPVTGYRHFAGGISKLKQVTGRGHRDIQRYIVGLISGAAPRRFVIAIRALMDVRYLAQSPAPDDDLLESIDQALLTFHQNKDIIMTLGARMGAKKPIENWHIPKLEFLQSITSGTCNVGALIQWSADATEHAHISEIKDPACHTNNNDYDPQICWHLDRDEKLRRFAIATTLKSHPTYHHPNDMPEDVPEEEDDGAIDCDEQEQDDPRTALLEEMNQTRVTMNYFSKARQIVAARDGVISYPPRTFIAGGTAIHLNYNPSRTGVSVDDVATNFNIPGLHVALSEFLLRDARERGEVYGVGGPRRRPLIDHPPILPFDRVQLWHTVRLQQTSFHHSSIILPAQTVHASPPGPGWPKGRQDAVLVNVEGGSVWPKSGLTGHAICELHLIMCPMPRRGSRITWRDQYLCYVQVLTIGSIDPATEMIILKCAKYTDGTPIGNIVPLCQLRSFISLIPRLGDVADARFTKATSMHYSQSFLLNKYFDKDFYYAHYHASRSQ